MNPTFTITGQCSFTYQVIYNCIKHGFIPSCIAIENNDPDNDPFSELSFKLSPFWWQQHWFYYYGWKESLLNLCKEHNLTLIIKRNVTKELPQTDVLIVAGYTRKISSFVTERYGKWALNVHPSLLPLFKGPQPEAQILLAKLNRSAISIHHLSDKLDSGEIYYQNEFLIRKHWNVADMERIEALIASRGIATLLGSFPLLEPLKIDNLLNESYFKGYDKDLLCLNGMNTDDEISILKLRLRPEGYAFYETPNSTVYPIFTNRSNNLTDKGLSKLDAIVIKERHSNKLQIITEDCITFLNKLSK